MCRSCLHGFVIKDMMSFRALKHLLKWAVYWLSSWFPYVTSLYKTEYKISNMFPFLSFKPVWVTWSKTTTVLVIGKKFVLVMKVYHFDGGFLDSKYVSARASENNQILSKNWSLERQTAPLINPITEGLVSTGFAVYNNKNCVCNSILFM